MALDANPQSSAVNSVHGAWYLDSDARIDTIVSATVAIDSSSNVPLLLPYAGLQNSESAHPEVVGLPGLILS